MKKILFVDDEPKILEGLQRMLRPQRREWKMCFAVGPEAALAMLDAEPFDVVVTDMRMPRMDGAALLAEVKRRYPATVRIILSGFSDSDASARATQVAHQFLSKPCSADMLKDAVNRASTLKDGAPNDVVREMVGGIDTLPALPDMYRQISEMLSRPEPSIMEIVKVLGKDIAISAKLLQLVNSSFFGIGRRVTTVREAVELLGIGTVQGLVLSTEIFRTFPGRQEMRGICADDLSAHSLKVASLARRLAGDRVTAEIAHSVGLLHDVGKLVLADRVSGYEGVVHTAMAANTPLHQVEQDELGATHAEVGAYLLGLWNLPEVMVQAVANHHSPDEIRDLLGPCEIVRVANALVHRVQDQAPPDPESSIPGDVSALAHPGVSQQLTAWFGMLESHPDGTAA